jgi:hypothetical protein
MATIHDTFNRADNDTLGTSSEGWSWSEREGDIDIVSGTAVGTLSGGNYASAQIDLDTEDHYAQIVVTNDANDSGPVVRWDPANKTFYAVFSSNSLTRLFKFVTGTGSQVGSNGPGVVNNSILKLEVIGDQLTVYDDGVAIIGPETDGDITGFVRCGMVLVDANSVAENFEAGDVTTQQFFVLTRF